MYEQLLKDLKEIIEKNKDELSTKIEIMAIVTKALEPTGIRPVIVGGQAVEFYTAGGYTTMDIDVICDISIREINEIISPLGFTKQGKYWVLDCGSFEFIMEVPSGPLAGSREKLTKVNTKKGYAAYFIGIEDIIIDRLNRFKYWQEFSDEEWIIGMILLNYDDIDWEYLLEKSQIEGTKKELQELKEKAEKLGK